MTVIHFFLILFYQDILHDTIILAQNFSSHEWIIKHLPISGTLLTVTAKQKKNIFEEKWK